MKNENRYQIFYFRQSSRNNFKKLGNSLKFKIVKQPKKIVFDNLINPYEFLIINEENPDFYKKNNETHNLKYINIQKIIVWIFSKLINFL